MRGAAICDGEIIGRTARGKEMSGISIVGAGAFGTALAISLAATGEDVTLWSRSETHSAQMAADRENKKRLPDCPFPASLHITSHLNDACRAEVVMLAIPMQSLVEFARQNQFLLGGKLIVACCKGVDLATGQGPVELLEKLIPTSKIAILSGPSFAVDIARGLPTALTLAGRNAAAVSTLQTQLSTNNIRLYSSLDPTGVEFGGALKNVMAIACGIVIGAGLGESARAALMTRGYAEMQRLAADMGADPSTLSGLSGFGDLVLTCTSQKSRNFSHGIRLGKGEPIDLNVTVEGVATAHAVAQLAQERGIDMPITQMVTRLLNHETTVQESVAALFARPLKKEKQ